MNAADPGFTKSETDTLLAALEASDDMTLLLDDGGGILYASPSSEKLLGISPAVLCQRTIHDLDPGFPSADVLAGKEATAPRRISARFSTAAGDTVPVDVAVAASQDGVRTVFLVSARPLPREVKFLGTILNTVPARVGVIDRTMHLVKWSAHRTYEPERTLERLPTTDFLSLLPVEIRPRVLAAIELAFEQGSAEMELSDLSESSMAALLFFKRIVVDGEPFVAMLAMDVTERRRAESALRESEERFRSIVHGSIDGIVLIDPGGCVVEWNPGQETITGLRREDVIGRPSWEVRVLSTPKEKRDENLARRYEQSIREGLETGDAHWLHETVESEIERPDGERSTVETVHFTIDLGRGRMLGSISRDITRAKNQERALQDYADRLKALATRLADVQEAERVRLSAELHDQVGQGLTALDLTLTAAARSLGSDSKGAKDHIEQALNLTQQTASRMRDLMAEMRPIALDEYGFESALRWYVSRLAAQTERAVLVESPETFPRLTEPVETALFRIAQEALTNALKHSGAKEILVILSSSQDHACVIISDNGCGFAPADPAGPTDRGWGLMIMEERAAAVGGCLSLVSTPGEGTRVRIEVPCR